ncbi:MAG: ATP-binding domain-containing protein [Dehalococcoidia bacterium]|nr:ATP-binding domain-containing protein [Dehalococcoidia bacterium]
MERPTPAETLFIGPSRPFLDYTADILPGLGVRERVMQTTLRQWMAEQRSVRVQFQSHLWNHLLSQGELTLYSEEAESLKGSLDMVSVLERYVAERSKRIGIQCVSALKGTAGEELERFRTLSRAEAQNALDTAFAPSAHNSPLNKRRADFINSVASMARAKISTRYVDERREAEGQAEAWCRRVWPRLNVREEYLALLSNPDALVRLPTKRISEAVAEELAESADKASRGGLLDSDEGAITYLDHLLNGTIRPTYRHIVVDEAQDISPIEFKLLSTASFNNSFTVMGDLAQRLRPYKGIQRWGEVGRVLNQKETKVQQARMSYRSNNYITRFNNRVMRLYEKNLDAPLPLGREGHRPEYHLHSSREDMYATIINELGRIRSFDGMREASIAILVRDRANLNAFQKFCNQRNVNEIAEIGAKDQSGADAVLARIPDARGLEYDAVIVLGVNDTFSDTMFNQKLLYVAITRAKHYLALHWAGRQSPILRRVYSGGVRQLDHRRGK